jgi:hypothetical protein
LLDRQHVFIDEAVTVVIQAVIAGQAVRTLCSSLSILITELLSEATSGSSSRADTWQTGSTGTRLADKAFAQRVSTVNQTVIVIVDVVVTILRSNLAVRIRSVC